MKPWCQLTSFLCLTVFFSTVGWGATEMPRPRGLVNDFANVVSPEFELKMVQITEELLRKTGVPIVVVTVPEIGSDDYKDYANRLYEKWGIGKKGDDRGVLVFVAIKERKLQIETGYGIEGIIPDGVAGEIRDRYMIPFLKEDRFGEGLLNGTIAIAKIVAKDAGVTLSGRQPARKPSKRRSGLPELLFGLIFLAVLFSMGRRRGGLLPLLVFMSMGRGMGYHGGRGGFGGSFGGFGGGFGGFGGGLSGGGGAGGSF